MSTTYLSRLSGVSPNSDDYYGIRSAQDSETDDVFVRGSSMSGETPPPCQLQLKTSADQSKFLISDLNQRNLLEISNLTEVNFSTFLVRL